MLGTTFFLETLRSLGRSARFNAGLTKIIKPTYSKSNESMEIIPSTYDEALERIEELQEHAEILKQSEIEAFLADVKPKIIKYGLTPAQLGFTPPSKPGPNASASKGTPVKYRKNGKTWYGRGRKPEWMKELERAGIDIEKYRVE
ncbi:hypothetical protein GCM10027082_24810 [Comamonas humi]